MISVYTKRQLLLAWVLTALVKLLNWRTMRLPLGQTLSLSSYQATMQVSWRQTRRRWGIFLLMWPPHRQYQCVSSLPKMVNFEKIVQEVNEIIGVNYVCRIIYNFPAVSGGIDLSSDDVVDIADAAPNICGIMLSCVKALFCPCVKAITNIMIVAVMSENWQELLPLSITRRSKLSADLLTSSFHLLPSGLRVPLVHCPTSRRLVSHVTFW